MAATIKLINASGNLTSDSTVGAASVVSTLNGSASTGVGSIADSSGGAVVTSIAVKAGERLNIQKSPSQFLQGTADIKVTSVAYSV